MAENILASPTLNPSSGRIRDALAWAHTLDETVKPPSRHCYPGSTRLDTPRRRRAYAAREEEHDIARAVLKAHDALCSQLPARPNLLPDARASLCSPVSEHNLPWAPAPAEGEESHSIIILGTKGAGKTTLVRSFFAATSGTYPTGPNRVAEGRNHAVYGTAHALPEGPGAARRRVLLDTAPLDLGGGEAAECPTLCAAAFGPRPGAPRAALLLVDATARPLWEDDQTRRSLAKMLVLLKDRGYAAVVAVTKLEAARQAAVETRCFGRRIDTQGCTVGKEPRSSYESFVGQYLDKVSVALQRATGTFEGPASGRLPCLGVGLFDAPAWPSAADFAALRASRGRPAAEVPHWTYMHSQLRRLLAAAGCPAHAAAASIPPAYWDRPCAGPAWSVCRAVRAV